MSSFPVVKRSPISDRLVLFTGPNSGLELHAKSPRRAVRGYFTCTWSNVDNWRDVSKETAMEAIDEFFKRILK